MAEAVEIARAAYRYMHERPELGDQEVRAQAYVAERLRQYGFAEFYSVSRAPTAVITKLDSGRPGPTIALRCELDARKIVHAEEPAGHNPRSGTPGLMHSCGHDAHAAMLLGAASILSRDPLCFTGTLVFLFQPAEETVGGAPYIVEDGILERLGVQAVFAQHTQPSLPVGYISIEPGVFLAGSCYFDLELTGAGSHAAAPQNGADLPLVASEAVRTISELPARKLDIANRPALITVTKVVSDSGARNVIPSAASIAGTIRSFEDPRSGTGDVASIEALMRRQLDGLALAHSVKYDLKIVPGSPPCCNDEGLFTHVVAALRSQWPGELMTSTNRYMMAEDFAYYTAKHRCLYFSLGIAKDNLGYGGFHTRDFTIHPDALEWGILLMVLLAVHGGDGL
jgi:amidohydrolase